MSDELKELRKENERLKAQLQARNRVLTDDEKEELFLEQCLEHVRSKKDKEGDEFWYCRWYTEDVARLVELVRKYKPKPTKKPYNRDDDPNAMEFCCECGDEYPRSELLAGEIYCAKCRKAAP